MKFKIGDRVEITDDELSCGAYKGQQGVIRHIDENEGYLVYLDSDEVMWFDENELKLIESNVLKINQKSFQEIAVEIGKFTDMKNEAYGSSVDATYEVMKVFLNKYKNDDNTYTIPESLLKHIFLQVRMIDKQNRIFNNPDGDKMEESPYRDLAGYSLIGVRMTENE
ncbi:hypothetical protein ABEV41_00895 [Geobacillus thermodenitrificans]|uniref:hypothetical protein n=1 Tax=Geobacillus thermodenitrificans TaxID=33940 RepID=UPI003D2598AB